MDTKVLIWLVVFFTLVILGVPVLTEVLQVIDLSNANGVFDTVR